jgi:hypothetical protein
LLRSVTEWGIPIECNEDPENAEDSMHFSCESNSNKIEESNLQNEKYFCREPQHSEEQQSISMTIQKMLRIQDISIVNQIQMKSRKIIYNEKNITSRESHHNEE